MAKASLDEETAKKVIRQVEFYFSDSNLPRDGFLKKTINESEDGLVSLALVCSFSRMRSHLGLGGDLKPEDVSEETVKLVAETLRKSSLLKVSEDGKRIGRSTELSKLEEVIEQVDIRTIAVSPLAHDVTREELESFFGQYGKVNSVRLPRHVADKRFFCGTALIEFSSEEDTEKVSKQNLTYAGAELELKPKKDFDAERKKRVAELENSRSSKGSSNKDGFDTSDNYPKGLIVSFKLNHISARGSVEQSGTHGVTDGGNMCKTENEVASKENPPEESKQETLEKVNDDEAKLLDNVKNASEGIDNEKLTGEGEKGVEGESEENSSENASAERVDNETIEEKSSVAANRDNKDIVLREDLKNVFQKYGTVKYVDYTMGAESGFIRFEEPEAAQKARAAAVILEGGIMVKNFCASLEAVTGEAEREYWSKLRGSQDKYRDGKGNWGRGGRNNRGGKQFNGKHARSRGNDSSAGRPNKAQRIAA